MKNKTLFLTRAALIAAMYVVLTYIANALGLANGAIQVRFSEALTVLPVFTPAAVPGLAVGCLVSNLLTGCAIWDVIFGTLATLIGALGTLFIGKTKFKYLSFFPPVAANTLVVPIVIANVYGTDLALPVLFLTVFAGEIISCGILGLALQKSLEKFGGALFRD